MLDSLKPGQAIRCTITKLPRAEAGVDTIHRLMRQQQDIKRGLRKAQRRRRQGMVVYNRGNRDWYKREKCSKLIHPAAGAAWTMTYSLQIKPELASLDGFLKIEPA
ncbi:MAG: hypothetical protein JNM80_04915 [Phycisphaerae bacterium]|nr:hypothetical protein [Phycisphaerae bacterium]